ncbi:MAG: hypothetical protein IPK06_06205 [Ignavibacteriae bacterium]|nr:hypothetical protein [Ignavibacteriota bacterium]
MLEKFKSRINYLEKKNSKYSGVIVFSNESEKERRFTYSIDENCNYKYYDNKIQIPDCELIHKNNY